MNNAVPASIPEATNPLLIKTILVPFYGHPNEIPVLENAYSLDKRFGAHVRCLHISPDIKNLTYPAPAFSADMYEEIASAVEKEVREQSEEAFNLFEESARKFHIPLGSTAIPSHRASTSWANETGNVDELIGKEGRLCDLIIMDKHMPHHHESYSSAIVTALFETGRPVILMPEEECKNVGHHVAIAWDGSARAARAVGAALPFLITAATVHILTVDEEKNTGPLAQDLALYLAAHDIESKHLDITPSKGTQPGALILDESVKLNANMLVMGAFTHSRLRQMILGGVTNFMLENASIPVFMAH